MGRKTFSQRLSALFSSGVAAMLFFAAIAAAVVISLGNTSRSLDAEGLRTAEESIRRACVTCYAVEGVYPPNYDYLKNNYGLRVDTAKYAVHYEIFASNIMPDITVVRLDG